MFHAPEHALSQYNHPVTHISYWYVNITDSAVPLLNVNYNLRSRSETLPFKTSGKNTKIAGLGTFTQ